MPVKPLLVGTGKIDTKGKESVAKRIIFGGFKAINVQIAGQKNPKNPEKYDELIKSDLPDTDKLIKSDKSV